MNTVYCLTLMTLVWQSTNAWNLGTSYHDNPLFTSEPAVHCAGNDSVPCDLDAIQHQCTVQLSTKYPSISQHNFLLVNGSTQVGATDLTNQCCSTWELLQCLTSHICATCGTQKLHLISTRLMTPLRRTLESGQCKGLTADSLHCSATQFWLFGSIFIACALATSVIIFVVYRVRSRRQAAKPMYELFY